MKSSEIFDRENRALISLIRQGNQNGLRLLYLRNQKAVWKILCRKYPKDWVEAQSYFFLVDCVRLFDETKKIKFVTYWLNHCKLKSNHAWECEVNLIRYPSKPTHKRNDPNRGEHVLFMEGKPGTIEQIAREIRL